MSACLLLVKMGFARTVLNLLLAFVRLAFEENCAKQVRHLSIIYSNIVVLRGAV